MKRIYFVDPCFPNISTSLNNRVQLHTNITFKMIQESVRHALIEVLHTLRQFFSTEILQIRTQTKNMFTSTINMIQRLLWAGNPGSHLFISHALNETTALLVDLSAGLL